MTVRFRRFAYACLVLGIAALAWLYGGYMAYLTLYALLLLPAVSLTYAALLSAGLRVTQEADRNVVTRGAAWRYTLWVRSFTPLIAPVRCVFADDSEAVCHTVPRPGFAVTPFMNARLYIDCVPRYRGTYQTGVTALKVPGFLGLFAVQKRVRGAFSLTVLPRVPEGVPFPMARLLSQAQSAPDRREEDYTEIADIRAYRPDDSVKRVHWKLTAARGEWLVKNFQAGTRNRLHILIDQALPGMPDAPERAGLNGRPGASLPRGPWGWTRWAYWKAFLCAPRGSREGEAPTLDVSPRARMLALQTAIVETALAAARLSLRAGLPVVFASRGSGDAHGVGGRMDGQVLSDLEGFIRLTAGTVFRTSESGAAVLLADALAGAAGPRNMLLFTARLDETFCNGAVNAAHAGHTLAVVYFPPSVPDAESGRLTRTLRDSRVPVYFAEAGEPDAARADEQDGAATEAGLA